MNDDDETTDVTAMSNAELARLYETQWAIEWALHAALGPRPTTDLPDNVSGKEEET